MMNMFFVQFLSNNYKQNKNSYTIIKMNIMIVVNTRKTDLLSRRARPSKFDT